MWSGERGPVGISYIEVALMPRIWPCYATSSILVCASDLMKGSLPFTDRGREDEEKASPGRTLNSTLSSLRHGQIGQDFNGSRVKVFAVCARRLELDPQNSCKCQTGMAAPPVIPALESRS